MPKVVTIRLTDRELAAIERYRRSRPGSTQSAVIRDALNQWVQAQKRAELRAELAAFAADEAALRQSVELAREWDWLADEALRRVEGETGESSAPAPAER